MMLGENLERDSWIYVLAAHEYYWGDGATQIITDAEYDALTRILVHCWPMLPKEIKHIARDPDQIGQGAYYIKLTPEQLKTAYSHFKAYTEEKTHRELP